jgi:hypothetical protein
LDQFRKRRLILKLKTAPALCCRRGKKCANPRLPQFTTHPPAVGNTRRNFKPEAGTTFASLALGAGY